MLSVLSIVFAQTPECDGAAGDCAHPLFAFGDIFGRIIGILIPVGGIVLFVMLIIGGFYFITSSGDPRKVEGAKSTLTYAIAGIVILACAFLIIQIIANFVGVPAILNFNIYNEGV
ncbi:hypothetical protein A2803_01535 [Candidatus Woesebacteria bacterium RIFCSPHIGHO2_01_FULL_44_21]|uniref:Uncharacterized protein n=1 Tax=Candidatus Woesebacteria bacterium RIFCSPHIGHO2_01_FULL_44_21 TaxID=1802503 RepID=A0A1F7Z183_9BACT|nr:MAG: hypothetical protein A2803_01535 [Candidatus Woesebacteria bacterium RIFCSPHIGHO2_01_FULL_44_21]